jgi:plasmid stabilization system protein ParE
LAKIRWTQESLTWLEEIYNYIAAHNEPAAIRTIDGILEKCRLLTDHPELGYRYRESEKDEVRIILYGHYRIAYAIRTADVIEILGIYHAALDIDRLIE